MPKSKRQRVHYKKFTLCTANKHKRHAKPNRRPLGAACLVEMWLHRQKARRRARKTQLFSFFKNLSVAFASSALTFPHIWTKSISRSPSSSNSPWQAGTNTVSPIFLLWLRNILQKLLSKSFCAKSVHCSLHLDAHHASHFHRCQQSHHFFKKVQHKVTLPTIACI